MRVSCARRGAWEECDEDGRTTRSAGPESLRALAPAMEGLEPRWMLSGWGTEALAAGLIAPPSPATNSPAVVAPQRGSDAAQAGAVRVPEGNFAASPGGVTAEVLGAAGPYGYIGSSRLVLMPRLQLVVLGTDGDDTITISQTPSAVTVTTPQGSTTYAGAFRNVSVYGFDGNDTIRITYSVIARAAVWAGGGNDTVYDAGQGNDLLCGENGDDTLVAIGGGAKTATGGAGTDSLWVDGDDSTPDATPAETAAGNVHRIVQFYGGASMEIDGQALADPAAGAYAYASFASDPLFTDGPAYNDIRQGASGDCYLLASIAAVAYSNPNAIRQMITSLGDGTYAVRFYRSGSPVYLRVDADLPVYAGGSLVFAHLSLTGETWVALTEKAYAAFRTADNSYASIETGWMGAATTDLTGRGTQTLFSTVTYQQMYDFIANGLAGNNAVTLGSRSTATGLIVASHSYMVKAAFTADDGTLYVTVYNPWGYDGGGSDSDPNDGLITLTLTQLRQLFTAAVAIV